MKQAKIAISPLLFILILCVSACDGELSPNCSPTTDVTVTQGELSAGFRGNIVDDSCGGAFSGVTSVQHASLPGIEPVKPGVTILNFEHILTGFPDGSVPSGFTPREGLYPVNLLPEKNGVQLFRSADLEPWRVGSTLHYRVVQPHYIDFDFEVEFHDASLFHPDAVFFFASYMNWTDALEINFLGQPGPLAPEQWVQSAGNGVDPGESYIAAGSEGVSYAANAPFIVKVNFKNESWPRITQPFYYGLAGGGSVLALMFDQLMSEQAEIRFTVMRWYLIEGPRPVWDFAWVVRNPQNGQKARLRGRFMYKRFVSAEDVAEEYADWKAALPPDNEN